VTPEYVVQIFRQALIMTFWLSSPLLLVGFSVGILVSLLQILTSIQDNAFGTVPRLAAFLGALLLAMPWMLKQITSYTITLFGDMSRYAR
jgi:flagellar biosynthesis protein FliQ